MNLKEAYEKLSTVLPSNESVTIQTEVWWHYWDGKRQEPEVTFMVSWNSGPICNGPTLEAAVDLALATVRATGTGIAEDAQAVVDELGTLALAEGQS